MANFAYQPRVNLSIPLASVRSERADYQKALRICVPLTAICLALGLTFSSVSLWIPVGFLVFGLALSQILLQIQARRVPFLYLMLCVYVLQFLFASLYLYYHPPLVTTENIGRLRYPLYLSYAVPCLLALYLGVAAGTSRIMANTAASWRRETPHWAQYATTFCILGMPAYILSVRVGGGELEFVIALIAALRWVGVFTLILSGDRRWWFYTVMVLAVDLWASFSVGMFHDFILSSECLLLVLACHYRWRFRLLVALAVGLFAALFLQDIKTPLRAVLWEARPSSTSAALQSAMSKELGNSGGLVSDTMLIQAMTRFNQGWIDDRVMRHVPAIQPYANGSTLVDDARAAFLPRFIDPNKPQAGGKVLFEKYTGQRLVDTSMSIAAVGEMYANFGPVGGVAGMAVFGLVLGLIYRRLAKEASRSAVWWAWGPFLLLWAMKPEEDLMNIFNVIVKGGIVMALVINLANKPGITGSKHPQSPPVVGG